jgi:hypothetical protein
MRGSYRLKGDLDAVVEIDRQERGMNPSTFIGKQKDGLDSAAQHFTARPVECIMPGEGLVSTLVINPRAGTV